jgi:uncharacterized protein (DUF2267 family)
MQYQAFLDHVMAQPGPETEEAALRATKATLGTLGERIVGPLRDNVAAQLDEKLAPLMTAYSEVEEAVEPFALEVFYRRVSDRAGVGVTDAVAHARAVMITLREALTPGQWASLVSQLPEDYSGLLGEYPHEAPESYDVPAE